MGIKMSSVFGFVLRAIRKHSGKPIGRAVQRISYAIYRESNNPGYHFADNGELHVLQAFSAVSGHKTVLDVGANIGEWSKACVNLLGNRANVYAFEPSNRSFEKLRLNTQDWENIRPFQIGLSITDCELDILASDSVPQKSSVEAESAKATSPQIEDYRKERQRFVRGDGFCRDQGLEHIHFLKIDTEGHDLQVLAGFERTIANDRVDVIQFEYNRLNIFTKYTLNDFYKMLNEKFTQSGYLIGRIYPSGVLFKPYSVYDENFVDGNFLAVRAALPDLIAKFRI